MSVIDWIIFVLGCAACVVYVAQQRALRRRERERVESFGMVLLLLSYLEAQARRERDRAKL